MIDTKENKFEQSQAFLVDIWFSLELFITFGFALLCLGELGWQSMCCLRHAGGSIHLGSAVDWFPSYLSSWSSMDMTLFFLSSKWTLGYLTLRVANKFTISLITLHVGALEIHSIQLSQRIILCSVPHIWRENFHFSFWGLKVSRFFLCSIMLVITVAFGLISVCGSVYRRRRGESRGRGRRDCYQTPLSLLSLARGLYCA